MPFLDIHGSSIKTIVVAATILILASTGCRSDTQPAADADAGPSGEPESYSAQVVRAIDDGAERELSVTRVARSGELRREEWSEQASNRALIWRPDEGKAFLLDLDKRTYAELPLSFGRADAAPSDDKQDAIDPESVERIIDDAPSPVRVETRALADQTVENHLCKVYERRAVFSDGNAEVTKTFRATDLGDLAIRIEIAAEPQNAGGKIIISRRDVRLGASPDEFTVPPGFKKVDKLP